MSVPKKFPNDYPTNIVVPPSDAIAMDILLYRMVSKSPPDINDFLPTYKDPEQKRFFEKNKDNPAVYGTSFWANQDDLMEISLRFPAKFDNKIMYRCDIFTTHGVVKQTNKPSHHTVWFYNGEYP